MKPFIQSIFLILVFIAALVSCEKEINIQQQPYTSKLSIQCLITPGQRPKLFLNNTLPYMSDQVQNDKMFVYDAKVTLETNGKTEQLVPDSSFQTFFGVYKYYYIGASPIQADKTYTLTIVSKGVTYTASTTTTPKPVQIDSVTYVKAFKDVYGEHEGVVYYLKDDPLASNFYRSEMHRLADTATYWGESKFKSPILKNDETCRVTEVGRTIFSDASFQGGDFSFATEPVYKHKKNDTCYVFIQNCDKNIFDFYDELDQQMLALKNPFVEPVFLNARQFKNAYGVFGSYALSDSVLFIYPE